MKKGVSLVSLIIVIIVMVILAGIVVVTGLDSNENIIIDTFVLELLDVQNGVDEYYYRYGKYPSGNEYVLDYTKLESLNQFIEEDIVDDVINFKIVDLSLIGIKSTEFGSGKGKDIYVLSEKTGIVYYLEGIVYENKTYYTLTDELYDLANANNSDLVSTQDIKVYNVIFSPSTTEYTNKPVTVKIKIPKIAVINSITTTNNKSVGTETVEGLYKQIQINETSEDKTGNYKITVNYTYRGTPKISEYEVTNYDANLPTVTYTETVNGDLKTVNVTINSNNSKIKTIKYEREIVSNISYFKNYGKKITNNKFVIDKDSYFTIYVETESGTNLMENNLPEDWKPQVVDVVDGVPIPKGFVASGATGENKKDTGLVIYEGIDEVTDENVDDVRRERNQYVWVPVDKENPETKFAKNENSGKTVIGEEKTWWEVLPTTELNEENLKYMTKETLEEVQAMYASVKKYGGFYIARYEAGVDVHRKTIGALEQMPGIKEGTKIYSIMGKIPYSHVPWSRNNAMNEDTGGAVEISRKIYIKSNSNYGVVSTLTYDVQWDRAVEWFIETGTITRNQTNSIEGSSEFGNYSDHVINSEEELNEDALAWDCTLDLDGTYVKKDSTLLTYPKANGEKWLLTTGALKASSVNNIYDMAGNMYEWTMGGYSTTTRVNRGSAFVYSNGSVGKYNNPTPNGNNYYYGFRPSLYIKLK